VEAAPRRHPPHRRSGLARRAGEVPGEPEAKLVNVGLSLEGFQQIYYVEWFHRLLGRLTGVVVLAPLVFSRSRSDSTGKRIRQLLTLFALGALQGALGWFMVQSGLVNAPHVSPYRLTAHLLLALVLFAALLWVALDAALQRPTSPRSVTRDDCEAGPSRSSRC